MNLTIGHRYVTRAGAIVQVIERINTGLIKFDSRGKSLGPADLFVVRIIRYANGTDAPGDFHRQYAVHDDGHYHHADNSALDVVADASILGKAAAE